MEPLHQEPGSLLPPLAELRRALARTVVMHGRVRRRTSALLNLRLQKCASTLMKTVFEPEWCAGKLKTGGGPMVCTTLRKLKQGKCKRVANRPSCWLNVYDYSFMEGVDVGWGGAEFGEKLSSLATKVRYVDGHFKFGLHGLFHGARPDQYTYITSVRDPVHRIVSQHRWWAKAWKLPGTLDEWVRGELPLGKGFGGYMIGNHMTRV